MFAPTRVRRTLRWARLGLLGLALPTLAYCGFILVNSWAFQEVERVEFERLLVERRAAPADTSIPATGMIGRIEIARLGLSVMVMEGTSGWTLARAVGHISGTAMPGQPGNAGFAGHRDTFFRPLANVRRDDRITLTTLRGEYRYRVVSTRVVSPEEVSVLAPSASEILTLVTCYPFYFVGAAPERFIVRAERE
ncbi:MAG: class D sortase [Bryobacteraceae bacterium]